MTAAESESAPESASESALSDDETTPTPKRARGALLRWVIGVACVIALVVGAILLQVRSGESFDDSAGKMEDVLQEANDGWWALDARRGVVEDSVTSAEEIVEDAVEGLADQTARGALRDAAAAASESATDAATLLEDGLQDSDTEKPVWFWELWQSAREMDARAAAAAAHLEKVTAAESELDALESDMAASAVTLFESVEGAAAALEKPNVSARAAKILDLRDAAADVVTQTDAGSQAARAFTSYVTRVAALKESNAAELAEKAGTLSKTRLEIEAFARSISGGVVLDFDWAPIVNHMGGDWGMGGLATWDSARGGFSTITLSNSVAEQWPSPDARALVAHEVGHAISAKCSDKFDWKSRDANEAWATAWAISMGHTATGNGVWAYGYPPQAMIDKAATCR